MWFFTAWNIFFLKTPDFGHHKMPVKCSYTVVDLGVEGENTQSSLLDAPMVDKTCRGVI